MSLCELFVLGLSFRLLTLRKLTVCELTVRDLSRELTSVRELSCSRLLLLLLLLLSVMLKLDSLIHLIVFKITCCLLFPIIKNLNVSKHILEARARYWWLYRYFPALDWVCLVSDFQYWGKLWSRICWWQPIFIWQSLRIWSSVVFTNTRT